MSTYKCLNMRCQWVGSHEDGYIPHLRPYLVICPDCGDKTLEDGEEYDTVLAIWEKRWYSLQAILAEQGPLFAFPKDKQAGQVDQAPEQGDNNV